MNIPRKRSGSGSGSKKTKEKYEVLFKNEESDEISENSFNEIINSVNSINLESFLEILKNSIEHAVVKKNLNLFLKKCISSLDANSKRTVNILKMLCFMFYALSQKPNQINTVLSEEETVFELYKSCHRILEASDYNSHEAQDVCLKLLLVILTSSDNLNDNILIESLMTENLFDTLINLVHLNRLISTENCVKANDILQDVILIIILLANYRKNESCNPVIVQLSILADENILNSFCFLINAKFMEFLRQFSSANINNLNNTSWLTSLSSLVGNIFISDDDSDKTSTIRANNIILLALYENIHLNRNFITTLAHTQNESSPPSPQNTLKNDAELTSPITDVSPTNLFVSLFEYCSIVMKDNTRNESVVNTKLCFIILTCISEDSYACCLMHDENLNFKVTIHRAQMRHRKLPIDRSSMPLASTLFEVIVEFIVSHMSKQRFPMELYLLCIGIIHRLIVYQKRHHVRLNYCWKTIWSALINLLKFLVYQEQYLIKKFNIFTLATQVINIFNFFISYGDTFLKTTQMYDELYYELNREEKIFSELNAFVLRYSAMTDTEYKDDVLKLHNSLVNILAIIKHFQIKIKEWLVLKSLSTPTEEQILNIVRENYDLTLKLLENLDTYERYNEKKHSLFFNAIVSEVISDLRIKNCAKFLTDNSTSQSH